MFQPPNTPVYLSRRQWLRLTAGTSLACGLSGRAVAETLPIGSAPAPVACPHFPTLVHAFVWRNWQLVSAARMAVVLGVTAEAIASLGLAMGLDEAPAIPTQMARRGALTIIRRNWHLLPYEQLLQLLGWTAEQLAYTLREDDFFFVKLGLLKPKCPSLTWPERTEAIRQRETEIAAQVKAAFGESPLTGREPLSAFVAELSAPVAPAGRAVAAAGPLRFCYSYFALYGDPLLEPDLDPYPDGLMQRLSQSGVTGVWLQAVLAKLSPFPWQSEQSAHYEKRRENLRQLVARAKAHGIQVFLYLNEPRSLPLEFFQGHPELKGVTEGNYAALCTSVPAVRAYLATAIASLSRAVPDLGGYFSITASENLTNCWSHGQGAQCPRCQERGAAEVIAAVNATFAEGIQASGTKQRLLAWDWGWADEWAEAAIAKLRPEVSLMCVSEWSLPIERGGIKSTVGEYCLSAVGPGPRAKQHWAAARKRKLQVVAKLQVGLTWEFSAAPYLPVLQNVADHAAALQVEGVTDCMLGWTLGGFPSPNLAAMTVPLDQLATQYCPGQPQAARTFWRECSVAFAEFPYDAATVYNAPLQFGPANLLWSQPTNYKAAMVGLAYDDLAGWRSIYPEAVFLAQLEKTAAGFRNAIEKFRMTVGEISPAMAEQLRYAEVAAIHWQSVALQGRYVQARGASDRPSEVAGILEQEITLAKRLHALQSTDAKIGFEASNQYYYVPLDLVEKVICCQWLRETTK